MLTTGLVVALSAGVLSASVADRWSELRLVASARRRVLRAKSGERAGRSGRESIAHRMGVASQYWSSTAVSRFIDWPTTVSVALGAVVGGMVAVVLRSVPIGGAVMLSICVGYSHVRRTQADRSLEQLRAQLPQLFTVLASSVGAGLSLSQALTRAEQSCELPISAELRTVNSSLALGVPLPEALEQFANRSRVRELRSVAVGLGIQHTAGGGLVRILEHASYQLRQGEALRRSVRSHTAQGRMTLRMVTIVPVGLAMLLAVLSDDYLAVFTGTPSGRALLGLAIALESVGAYAVSRLLRVEV